MCGGIVKQDMGRSSRSERGSFGFVQWNESFTKDTDGRNGKSPSSTKTATMKMPNNKQNSVEFSSIAAWGVEDAGRRASSNIVASGTRIVMSCLTPTPGLSTPPPPQFQPPQQTTNTQSPSVTPRGTPLHGATRIPVERVHVQNTRNVRHTHTDGEHSNFEEHEDDETSTPNPRGDTEG